MISFSTVLSCVSAACQLAAHVKAFLVLYHLMAVLSLGEPVLSAELTDAVPVVGTAFPVPAGE